MLGDKLKQFRLSQNIRQTEFARKLGISQGFLSEVEKGKKIPGGDILKSLKQYFPELNMNWLFTTNSLIPMVLGPLRNDNPTLELPGLQRELEARNAEIELLKAQIEALRETLLRANRPPYVAEAREHYGQSRPTAPQPPQKVEVLNLKGISPEAIRTLPYEKMIQFMEHVSEAFKEVSTNSGDSDESN